ncbi:DUF3109 family protein [Pendulispora albinea]|uniref:DUF3109 family protein n=1 Tax=Pendulispora albinea TaxID=2741071 RepID=A0ABZ2LYQ6_9BACT
MENPQSAKEDLGYCVPLRRPYTTARGAPAITHVAPRIFTLTYFQTCMECTFCNDTCCQYGVGIDLDNRARILAHAEGLRPYVAAPASEWFLDEEYTDSDFPGARAVDSKVVGRGCVFLRPDARGCGIHAYCLDNGIDPYSVKPVYCSLFPLTVDGDWLVPSIEVDEKSLICVDRGTTLYRGSRDELLRYFGEELIAELDELEAATLGGRVANPHFTPPPYEWP